MIKRKVQKSLTQNQFYQKIKLENRYSFFNELENCQLISNCYMDEIKYFRHERQLFGVLMII